MANFPTESDDTITGTPGDDIISALGGDDQVDGLGGNDRLNGDDGSDVLNGDDGDDVLIGGLSNDTLRGGAGNDRFVYVSNDDSTNVARDGVQDFSPGDLLDVSLIDANDLAAGNQDFRFIGSQAFSGTPGEIRVFNFSGPIYQVETDSDGDKASDLEFLVIVSQPGAPTAASFLGAGVTAMATENDDVLNGTAADDLISALGGNDTVNGLAGNDLLGGDAGDDVLHGDAGNDELSGGEGNDILFGGSEGVPTEGSDLLNGGVGNDILVYASNASSENLGRGSEANGGDGTDVLVADFSKFNSKINTQISADETGGFEGQYSDFVDENVSFTSIENFLITGSNFDDQITTGTGDDVIFAGPGNDIVDGGGGKDLLNGESGDNTLIGGAGNDTISAEFGGEDDVNGGEGDDFLFFGAAFTSSDTVDGAAGTDSLGLLGNYNFTFDADDLNGIEKLFLFAGNRVDPMAAPVSYTLTTIDATVGAGGLFVTAASLRTDESLTFNGTAETDGAFDIIGGSGNDVIAGGAQNDLFQGGAGNDQLFGRGGNDTLVGGAGTDLLRGGFGRDIFRFDSVTDSTPEAQDMIADFNRGDDKVDLSGIDANENEGGDQAFAFIGDAAFSGQAGELRSVLDRETGRTRVEGDTDGDGSADFAIQLVVFGEPPLIAADFIL